MKTAVVIGSTGLVGTQLINLLVEDDYFQKIIILSRKSNQIANKKIVEIIVDFDHFSKYSSFIKGDVLFSTLGTTLKTAGSKENQYKIDFGYNFEVAQCAKNNGLEAIVLLSSAGASNHSKVFYSKMKGELDKKIKELSFSITKIIRPSMLVGKRKEFRFFEKIFTPIMFLFCWLPGLRKYRPIKDITVAKAMINSYKSKDSKVIYELEEVHQIAKKN